MRTNPTTAAARLLTLAVWLHAAVTAAHSAAHIGAPVPTGAAAMVYIWMVIIIGPIAGWWLARSGRVCAGSAVVAVCMIGALVFGGLNHFAWPGADHVSSIAAGPWRETFRVTAVLLAVTEALGAIAGINGMRVCLADIPS